MRTLASIRKNLSRNRDIDGRVVDNDDVEHTNCEFCVHSKVESFTTLNGDDYEGYCDAEGPAGLKKWFDGEGMFYNKLDRAIPCPKYEPLPEKYDEEAEEVARWSQSDEIDFEKFATEYNALVSEYNTKLSSSESFNKDKLKRINFLKNELDNMNLEKEEKIVKFKKINKGINYEKYIEFKKAKNDEDWFDDYNPD